VLLVAALMLAPQIWAQDKQAEDDASPNPAGYRLDAGDVINIRVLGEEDLSLEIEIGESGSITYPLLREVQVRGMTLGELESRMTRRLIDEEFLIDPDVSINIVEYRPFYINGEVEEPGSYPFEPGLTLRRAVSLAGGFTERASRSRITILNSDNEEIDMEAGEELLDMRISPGYIITVNQRFF
jgi:polysaccharide export outer membrane protein